MSVRYQGYSALVLDDDPGVRNLVRKSLENLGFEVLTAARGQEGLDLAVERTPDLAVLDIQLPDLDGLEVLSKIREEFLLDFPILMMTGHGSIDSAVTAMKFGASDYIQKPFRIVDFQKVIGKIIGENGSGSEECASGGPTETEMIGQTESMKSIRKQIERAARSDVPIVIYGENGTGKEFVARKIHEKSSCSSNIFLSIDCMALSELWAENDIFGYVKGAFVGADMDYDGLMVKVGRGTIFLNEIFEIPSGTQVKLLRALQEKAFRPQGSVDFKVLEARVMASSAQNLMDAVRDGKFSEELFYLLHIIPIHLPPLRDRTEDIPLLVDHFLEKYAVESGSTKHVSPEVLRELRQHDWPGNIRQLENVVHRAIVLSDNDEIALKDLPLLRGLWKDPGVSPNLTTSSKGLMEEAETSVILKVLEQTMGNKRKAAQILGISKTTLYAKLKKLEVQ